MALPFDTQCCHAFQRCHLMVMLQKSTPNLEGAFKYLKQHVGNKPFTPEVVEGLEHAAGVGVVVTPEEIDAIIDRHISKVKPQLQEQRYNVTCLLQTRLHMYASMH